MHGLDCWGAVPQRGHASVMWRSSAETSAERRMSLPASGINELSFPSKISNGCGQLFLTLSCFTAQWTGIACEGCAPLLGVFGDVFWFQDCLMAARPEIHIVTGTCPGPRALRTCLDEIPIGQQWKLALQLAINCSRFCMNRCQRPDHHLQAHTLS